MWWVLYKSLQRRQGSDPRPSDLVDTTLCLGRGADYILAEHNLLWRMSLDIFDTLLL